MADETPRLRLPIYTSGTDLHPTREDFNARMELLEEAVAIARQGTADDRPLPSTRGTLFMETDTRILWFDTGNEWIRVVRIGNDGPGRALNIDGDGSEGSSEWAARADHTHPLPLATSSQPGALSAVDKALLNTASANATSNALARRNGSGQMSAAAPSAATHLTPRSYVDSRVSAAMDNTSQLEGRSFLQQFTAPANINNLTTPGTYYQSDGPTTIEGGYPDDSRGGVLNVYHAWQTRYMQVFIQRITKRVFIRDTDDRGASWSSWTEYATTDEATTSSPGLMSSFDKRRLNGATGTNTPNSLVWRSESGQASIATPTSPSRIANKGYVDDQVGSVFEGAPLGNVNLNNQTTPGQFYATSSTTASEANNFPPGALDHEGILEVLRHISTSVMQRYTVAVGSHPMWIRRRYVNGNWSSWSRVGG